MNKSQELEVMVMRAEIYADEVMDKYEMAWHGQKAVEINSPQEQEEVE